MPGTGDYLIIGAVAAVVTFAATPLVGRLARSRGWLYLPSERTVHTTPIPAIGGLAMFVGFIVAFAVARLLDRFDSLFARNSEPRGISAAVIILVGGAVRRHPRLAAAGEDRGSSSPASPVQ